MCSKKVLRKQIASTLKKLDPTGISSQSGAAATSIRSLRQYREASKVAFYMHMDTGELQTATMIENAFLDGKRVFLPHIVQYEEGNQHPWFPTQKTHLRMLEMPDLQSVLQLEARGKYRLKEPTIGNDALNEGGLDLIVLPGVGFSPSGGRLGHGAGYYDSYIKEHEAYTGRVPQLVGVGLSEQLVSDGILPVEEHDRMLDNVILAGQILK